MGNSEKGGLADDSVRYLSVQDDTLSYLSMEEGREYMIENPRYNYLSEIKDAPWSLVALRHTLRKVRKVHFLFVFVSYHSVEKSICCTTSHFHEIPATCCVLYGITWLPVCAGCMLKPRLLPAI